MTQFTVSKEMAACRFYQNALRSKIVYKCKLTSFEEQTGDNRSLVLKFYSITFVFVNVSKVFLIDARNVFW